MKYLFVILLVALAFYIGFKYSPEFYFWKNAGACDNTSDLKKQLRAEIIELEKQVPYTKEMELRKREILSILKTFNNCKVFGQDYKCIES